MLAPRLGVADTESVRAALPADAVLLEFRRYSPHSLAEPADAITWDGTTIKIDHELCLAYGPDCGEVCVDICPSTILHHIGERPVPEPTETVQV